VLGNILYGSATLQYGNLKFRALAAGAVGQQTSLTVTLGSNATWQFAVGSGVTQFTLTLLGQTTAPLSASGLSASVIQTALEGLSSVESGNCSVAGTGPFTISLSGTLANTTEAANGLTAAIADSIIGSITTSVTVVQIVAGGSTIAIQAANVHLGSADLYIGAPAGTTEGALIRYLKTAQTLLQTAVVDQTGGDGTAGAAALTQTAFAAPTDGLVQHLNTRLNLPINWDERQLVSSSVPVGQIIIGDAAPVRERADGRGPMEWKGAIQVAIAFQGPFKLSVSNTLLDLYRRALYDGINAFAHPELMDKGKGVFVSQDDLKVESAGTPFERANLAIAYKLEMQWTEPAQMPFDFAGTQVAFSKFQVTTFRMPLRTNAWVISFDCASFTLSVLSQTTIEITAGANLAAVIQQALEQLSNIGTGNVGVVQETSGPYAYDYLVTFSSAISPLAVLTGTAAGGNAHLSIIPVTIETVPGDVTANQDAQFPISGNWKP
jgi:hypothetical protein